MKKKKRGPSRSPSLWSQDLLLDEDMVEIVDARDVESDGDICARCYRPRHEHAVEDPARCHGFTER